MNTKSIKPAFTDTRGTITDIVHKIDFDAVTIITSKKNAIRGNHFHKKTTQYAYVLSGSILGYSQMPNGKVERKTLYQGDMMISSPLERHAIHALEDSKILVITKGPRNGLDYEEDTFRVDPLHLDFDNTVVK